MSAFWPSRRHHVGEGAADRIGLRGLQRGIVAVERRAIGTDLLVVVAHVEEDVRMVVRNGRADAHEFLYADLDCAVAAVVLEMGNAVPSHVMLRAGLFCRPDHNHLPRECVDAKPSRRGNDRIATVVFVPDAHT